jgi:uncharacterized protein
MTRLPPLELLESTHKFPTRYIFKVIGSADDGFLARALAGARHSAKLSVDPEFTVRQSEHGKHLSVTLSVPAESAQQVLDVYSELSTLKGLVLLM